METAKKNWTFVAGVTLVLLMTGLFINHEISRKQQKDEIRRLKAVLKKEEKKKSLKWPKPRGIVNATGSYAKQKQELTAWMEGELSIYFKVKSSKGLDM